MDPVTILGLASSVAQIAQVSFSVGEAIRTFVSETRRVDQVVQDLGAEALALGDSCKLVEDQLQDVVNHYPSSVHTGHKSYTQLWLCIEASLEETLKTITQLEATISGIKEPHSNIVKQAWRQVKLNMAKDEITSMRNRIHSHKLGMHTMLLLVVIKVCHLAPQQANQTLVTNLDQLQTKIEQLQVTVNALNSTAPGSHTAMQSNTTLLACARDIYTSGQSFYESSIASGSVVDPTISLASEGKVLYWMQDLQALKIAGAVFSHSQPNEPVLTDSHPYEASATRTDGDLESASGWLAVSRPDAENEESDDDIDFEVAGHLVDEGREAFAARNWDQAQLVLPLALADIKQLSWKQQTKFDLVDIEFMLATCAYVLQPSQAAQAALLSVTQLTARSVADGEKICTAGILLTLLHLKANEIDQARVFCQSAMRGLYRLFGREHEAYLESVALMVEITRRHGDHPRADAYSRMIPQDKKDIVSNVLKNLEDMGSKTTGEGMPSVEANVEASNSIATGNVQKHESMSAKQQAQQLPKQQNSSAITSGPYDRHLDVGRLFPVIFPEIPKPPFGAPNDISRTGDFLTLPRVSRSMSSEVVGAYTLPSASSAGRSQAADAHTLPLASRTVSLQVSDDTKQVPVVRAKPFDKVDDLRHSPAVSSKLLQEAEDLKLSPEGGEVSIVQAQPTQTLIGPQGTIAAMVGTVHALSDFTPSRPGELAFRKDDTITVLESVGSYWWKGRLRGQVGVFPTNYVAIEYLIPHPQVRLLPSPSYRPPFTNGCDYSAVTQRVKINADFALIGNLHITIVGCTDLPKAVTFPYPNPYAVVRFDRKPVGVTYTKVGTTHPRWNENFQVYYRCTLYSVLDIQVWDGLSKILLGRTGLQVRDVLTKDYVQHGVVKRKLINKTGKHLGTVLFFITLDENPVPEIPPLARRYGQ